MAAVSGFDPIVSNEDADSSKSKSIRALRWAALFLGECRDGMTMLNMQSTFLNVSRNYSGKQLGSLFLAFGISQCLFQSPAGYFFDYAKHKVFWLCLVGVATTSLTLFTAIFAKDAGANLWLMIIVKFLQGAVTSFIVPGLNSISQGIVGAVGMTKQVAVNEMANHLGATTIMLVASVVAFILYPNIGVMFVVSPIACLGAIFFLSGINSKDIDLLAARGLTSEVKGGNVNLTPTEVLQEPLLPAAEADRENIEDADEKAETPLQVLKDPVLLLFLLIIFLFHLANATALPLVMQKLAIGNGRSGILMSGLCIIVSQGFMILSAKICGQYSAIYGRKFLFSIGFLSLPIRCLLLFIMFASFGESLHGSSFLQVVVLSTQILDGVGAGVFGTMYVLVTSDISGGTGRFSLVLGMTSTAVSVGGTISGYMGEALSEDVGYMQTFLLLAAIATVPALLFMFVFPETLPDYVDENETTASRITSNPSEESELTPSENDRTV